MQLGIGSDRVPEMTRSASSPPTPEHHGEVNRLAGGNTLPGWTTMRILVNPEDNNWDKDMTRSITRGSSSQTHRLSRSFEPILDAERGRYDNTDQGLDEPRQQRMAHDGYAGAMGYTQNSVRAHRNPLITESLTPITGGVQGTANKDEEGACAAILPQDLMIPQPDSPQRVPLYRRLYGAEDLTR